MAKSINIVTTNKELYEKLNMLNIHDEIILYDATARNIGKILNSINKYNNN
jgi:hypothetical protein